MIVSMLIPNKFIFLQSSQVLELQTQLDERTEEVREHLRCNIITFNIQGVITCKLRTLYRIGLKNTELCC